MIYDDDETKLYDLDSLLYGSLQLNFMDKYYTKMEKEWYDKNKCTIRLFIDKASLTFGEIEFGGRYYTYIHLKSEPFQINISKEQQQELEKVAQETKSKIAFFTILNDAS